jgi:hypothetical protein
MNRAKYNGQNARLVRDKLYINGTLYTDSDHREHTSQSYRGNAIAERDTTRTGIKYGFLDSKSRYENAHRGGVPQVISRNYSDVGSHERTTWVKPRTPVRPNTHTGDRPEFSFENKTRFSSMHDRDPMETDTGLNSGNRKNKASSPLNDQSLKKYRDNAHGQDESLEYMENATRGTTVAHVHSGETTTHAGNGTSNAADTRVSHENSISASATADYTASDAEEQITRDK